MLRHRLLFGAGLTAFAALIAACGGGGGAGSSPIPRGGTTASQTTGATIKVFIPASGVSSSTRKPAFVSPATATINIAVYTVNGATPSPTTAPTSVSIASSTDCTSGTSGVTCTISVTVPVATAVVLQISEYDASGNLLAQSLLGPINTTLATIATQTVSVGGVPATLVISPSGLSAGDDGQTHTITFSVAAQDASGNTIIPPGAYPAPIALSISGDTNNALSLSTTSVASPGPSNGATTVTLTYNSATAITQATIKATSGSINTSVPFAPIVFSPTSLPSLFVGGSSQTVTVSEAGYAGAFNVPGASSTTATVTCVPSNCTPSSAGGTVTITVAPGGAGTETVSIVDANGGFANLPITVTASSGGGEAVAPPYKTYEYATQPGGTNYGITVGPDGQTLWFVDQGNAGLGSVTNPAGCTTSCGTIVEQSPSPFVIASGPPTVESITAASDGNLYVTDVGNGGSNWGNLFQLTCPSATSCTPNTYPYWYLIDSTPVDLTDVLAGPDGNLYVSSDYPGTSYSGYSAIAWTPVAGCCTSSSGYIIGVAPPPSAINMMAFDQTGQALWFTDNGNNTVGYVGTMPCEVSCTAYEPALGGSNSNYGPQGGAAHRGPPGGAANRVRGGGAPPRRAIAPRRHRSIAGPGQTSFVGPLEGIVAAPDGNIYVADAGGGTIDQISPSTWESCSGCTFTAIALPNASAIPMNLTIGRDGNVWFTDSNGYVGFVALNTCASGTCKAFEYNVGGSPWGITGGPDGNIWFTDSSTNKIGKVVL